MHTEIPKIDIEQSNPNSVEARLDTLGDFSLEKIRCQELLPKMDGKETFVFTKLLENICNANTSSNKILNSPVS